MFSMLSAVPPPIFALWRYGTPAIEEAEANKRWLALEVDQKAFECIKAKTFLLFYTRLRLLEDERKELFPKMKALETRDTNESIYRGNIDPSWAADTLDIKARIGKIDKTIDLILERLKKLTKMPTPTASEV
jgi:hypothetical protein